MTVAQIVEELKRTPGCKCYEPLPLESLQANEDLLGLQFPEEYREFLQLTNGCEAHYGHYRIFGFDTSRSIDAVSWNQNDCWKFAWNGVADGYWCFGENAFGDQYSFWRTNPSNLDDAQVYQLHHGSMATEAPWNGSFEAFLLDEFLRNALSPYSAQDRRAIETIGPLELESHVVFVPSLLFLPVGDDGLNAELQVMPARAAMISNGDLCTEWDAGCAKHQAVERVEPYMDDQGLMRLRIVWTE